jgi:purine-binding chemotaxis protein CheW
LTRLVVFDLNAIICAVDALQVIEILNYQSIKEVPDMPSYFAGVINLRGEAIPVVDLNREFMGGETERDDIAKIIISDIKGQKAGFLVNSVREVALFDESEIKEVPPIIKNENNRYIKNILIKTDSIINIVDFSAILAMKHDY